MTNDACQFQQFHCPRYNELPTLALYMDQVLIVLEESLSSFSNTSDIVTTTTSTMINNYVKQRIIAPPQNKKYSRDHLARLMMICVLKRQLSIQEISGLFDMFSDKYTTAEIYDIFADRLEWTLKNVFSEKPVLTLTPDPDNPALAMLDAALIGFGSKMVLQNILHQTAELRSAAPKKKEPAKKP